MKEKEERLKALEAKLDEMEEEQKQNKIITSGGNISSVRNSFQMNNIENDNGNILNGINNDMSNGQGKITSSFKSRRGSFK